MISVLFLYLPRAVFVLTCRVILKMTLSVLSSQIPSVGTPLPALLTSPDDSASDTRAFLARETSLEPSSIPCLVDALLVGWVMAGLLGCGVTETFSSSALRTLLGSAACDDCPGAGDWPGDDWSFSKRFKRIYGVKPLATSHVEWKLDTNLLHIRVRSSHDCRASRMLMRI